MAKMENQMPSINPAATSPLHRALAAGIALAVAGCSVVPEKITPEQVASRVQIKFIPDLIFSADTTFDEAEHISCLLHKPEVARDIWPGDQQEGDAPEGDAPEGDEQEEDDSQEPDSRT